MKSTNRKKHYTIQPNRCMGKKIVMGGLIALLSIGAFAQNGKKALKKSEMTPEQRAELQTKKMALHLDLTEAQQEQVFTLHKEHAIARDTKRKEMRVLREKGEKPTGKSAYERKNAKLDAQLAHQAKMKTILNDTQFETWKKYKMRKGQKMKKSKGEKRQRKHGKWKKE